MITLNRVEGHGFKFHAENIDSCYKTLESASFIGVGDGLADAITSTGMGIGNLLGLPMTRYWKCELMMTDEDLSNAKRLIDNGMERAIYIDTIFQSVGWLRTKRFYKITLTFIHDTIPTPKELLEIIQPIVDNYRFTATIESHL